MNNKKYNELIKNFKERGILFKTVSKQDVIDSKNTIMKYIDFLEEENNLLQKELNNYDKDDEIQKLQNEIDDIKRKTLVELTDLERTRLDEFRHSHYQTCKGKTEVNLSGTGLGWVITLKCNKCCEELDITDYDMG